MNDETQAQLIYLKETLGRPMVAYIFNENNVNRVSQWCKGKTPSITVTPTKLGVVCDIVKRINEATGDKKAALHFLESVLPNVYSQGVTAGGLLRVGLYSVVLEEADDLISHYSG